MPELLEKPRTCEPLGLIPRERLTYLPLKHWAAHEFCFHLHDQMVMLAKGFENEKLHNVTVKFRDEDDAKAFSDAENFYDYLDQTGRQELSKKIVLNQIIVPIFSDFLHFVHEALKALEKRKLTFAISVLRKPLKENFPIATLMLVDQDEFYRRLKTSPYKSFKGEEFSKQFRLSMWGKLAKFDEHFEIVNGELIETILFDHRDNYGFAALFDKANHLTTHYETVRTEPLNLNFIFSNPERDDLYDHIYPRLAYCLRIARDVMHDLMANRAPINPAYRDLDFEIADAAFFSLFIKGKSPYLSRFKRLFEDFLICQNCKTKLTILANNAPKFFTKEICECSVCGYSNRVPVEWLLSVYTDEIIKRFDSDN